MGTSTTPVSARQATLGDVDTIVDTMTSAFFNDPLWGPTFPDAELRAGQAGALWRLFVTSSYRYPWTLVTDKVEAAAVWIPPGGHELSDDEAAAFEKFMTDAAGPSVAQTILGMFEKFEAARPSEPHYYLSLLATHTDHRGSGLGMGLLRENLARIDALGGAAYLESSNPAANDKRYASVGFTQLSEINFASGQTITTMWRPAQAA